MNLGKFAVQAALAWNPFGAEAYARRDANKAYRKARRKARRGETITEQEREILQTQEVGMLEGKKTYLGIVVAVIGMALGWFGVGDSDAGTLSAQIGAALDQIITVAGLLFAAYGRAKAKPVA